MGSEMCIRDSFKTFESSHWQKSPLNPQGQTWDPLPRIKKLSTPLKDENFSKPSGANIGTSSLEDHEAGDSYQDEIFSTFTLRGNSGSAPAMSTQSATSCEPLNASIKTRECLLNGMVMHQLHS